MTKQEALDRINKKMDECRNALPLSMAAERHAALLYAKSVIEEIDAPSSAKTIEQPVKIHAHVLDDDKNEGELVIDAVLKMNCLHTINGVMTVSQLKSMQIDCMPEN